MKNPKKIITFDINLKLKKTFDLSTETLKRINNYCKKKGKHRSPFIEQELQLWMKHSSGWNYNDLIKEADLKEEHFMRRFIEELERLGLDIPRNQFSSKFEERLNKRLDLYEKK